MRRPPTRRRPPGERASPRRHALPGTLVVAAALLAALAALWAPRFAVGVAVGAVGVAAWRRSTVPDRPSTSDRSAGPSRRVADDAGSRSH